MANTAWLYPSAVTVYTDGNTSWSNPNYALASDDQYASVSSSKGNSSHTLRLTGFSPGLPANAFEIGMEVAIERKASTAGPIDKRVQWFNGLAQVGANKASSIGWPTLEALAYYGSSNDGWSAGLSVAGVNSAAAGIDVAVLNNSYTGSRTSFIDSVSVRFFYNIPGYSIWNATAQVTGSVSMSVMAQKVIGAAVPVGCTAAVSAAAELVESSRVHYTLSHPMLGVKRYVVVVRRGDRAHE
jgi:hypothetical protein